MKASCGIELVGASSGNRLHRNQLGLQAPNRLQNGMSGIAASLNVIRFSSDLASFSVPAQFQGHGSGLSPVHTPDVRTYAVSSKT